MDYQKQIDEFLQAAARLQYLAAIPLHMHNGLGAYIVHGQAPGTFLSAVIENDFKTACPHPDDQNTHCLIKPASDTELVRRLATNREERDELARRGRNAEEGFLVLGVESLPDSTLSAEGLNA